MPSARAPVDRQVRELARRRGGSRRRRPGPGRRSCRSRWSCRRRSGRAARRPRRSPRRARRPAPRCATCSACAGCCGAQLAHRLPAFICPPAAWAGSSRARGPSALARASPEEIRALVDEDVVAGDLVAAAVDARRCRTARSCRACSSSSMRCASPSIHRLPSPAASGPGAAGSAPALPVAVAYW